MRFHSPSPGRATLPSAGSTRGHRPVDADEELHGIARPLEILIAASILAATLPILLMAMAAIKIENPRAPVIFRQTRHGYKGTPFTIYKLRTMIPNAEAVKASLVEQSVDKGPGFKIDKDPRITSVGRVLRRLYVDEIPQLLNVLGGSMALVGPRPNSYAPSVYKPWQRIRLAVKPGLTGPWQVAKDKPLDFDDRCRMDIAYLNHKSGYTDLKLIMQTAAMLLLRPMGQ